MASILIVDDNLLIRTLLRDILGSAGHEVVGEAADGVEAVDCYRALAPDLVTLDLVMPKRDGLTTLAHLRVLDASAAVVICSAQLTGTVVTAALKQGAKGFVSKPFTRRSVLDAVTQVLGDGRDRMAVADQKPATSADASIDVPERREFGRIAVNLPIVVRYDHEPPIRTVTTNISGGGIALARSLLSPGVIVTFRLDLPDQEPINGRARVVRTTSDGGHALAIQHLSVADHERLIGYIGGGASDCRNPLETDTSLDSRTSRRGVTT